jgi:hypothetical protein
MALLIGVKSVRHTINESLIDDLVFQTQQSDGTEDARLLGLVDDSRQPGSVRARSQGGGEPLKEDRFRQCVARVKMPEVLLVLAIASADDAIKGASEIVD